MNYRALSIRFTLILALALGGCSSDSGDGAAKAPATAGPLASQEDAARFLTQTTFGPTLHDIELVVDIGFEEWLERQFATPRSSHTAAMAALPGDKNSAARIDAWYNIAINGEDQLRQRVAFALSEIFVVSELEAALSGHNFALADYYDMLARNAFGDFRDLLEEVTLHPVMGKYLSMLGNEKPDTERNIRPDENYARELMQLFTIGLVELNLDGTPRLDANGDVIPTYDQSVIEGFAHVYTGWTFALTERWSSPRRNYFMPMRPWEEFHDTGEKRVLGGAAIPAGQTAWPDLRAALDIIFAHPNVGPFIARQLIQRLVTSNPSPAYVERVASVFNDDGGMRGNLRAVVKGILLDDEARNGHVDAPETFGKLKEPLLRQTALWRAFSARAPNGRYEDDAPERELIQAPLRSPSVFNFFRPDYSQPGAIAERELVAPEFQITTESSITSTTNRFYRNTFRRHQGVEDPREGYILIDIEREKALASDPAVLVDHLDLLLLGSQMSAVMRNALIGLLNAIEDEDASTQRALEAIYLIVTSPEYAVQK